MAEPPRAPGELPEAAMAPPRRSRPQLVWIIPIVAALAGGWLAVKSILEKGPVATITFLTAEGLDAGKTKIKYKDVDIGEIQSIAVSADDQHIVATAQFQKAATKYLVKDTRFWVVRPRLGLGGVSGLGTLFSGAYLAIDVGKSPEAERSFTGLEVPPIVTASLAGRQYVLQAHDIGSLDVGSPVYFRRIQVGQMVAFNLEPNGKGVTLKVFVNAPYDKFVTPNTRFWNAGGVDITLDAAGLRVNTESLASIIAGGIAFEDPPDSIAVAQAEADAAFRLAPDRTSAMKSPDIEVASFRLYFPESLRGLSVGAPVDFGGVGVGEVRAINVEYDAHERRLRFPVTIDLYRGRLRSRLLSGEAEEVAKLGERVILDDLVREGYRAQLRTGNLLTGQLYIAFDRFPSAPPAKIDYGKTPPELPTRQGGLQAVQEMIAKLATRIDQLPIEEIAENARIALRTLNTTLENTNELVKALKVELAPEMKAVLQDARQTLNTAEQALSSDSPSLVQVREALRELARAAEAVRLLAETLEKQPESLIRGKRGDSQ